MCGSPSFCQKNNAHVDTRDLKMEPRGRNRVENSFDDERETAEGFYEVMQEGDCPI